MKKLIQILVVVALLVKGSVANAGYILTGLPMSVSINGFDNVHTQSESFFIVFSGTTVANTTWTYTGNDKSSDLLTDPDYIAGLTYLIAPYVYTQGYLLNFGDFRGAPSTNGLIISYRVTAWTGWVHLLNGNGDILQSMPLMPEPATLLLLGLGAVVLRKRKR